MAAVGSYGHVTLNGNWAEDRLQPPGALQATGSMSARKPRSFETDIAFIGDRYDVLSRISRMPQRESYATPDDGFRDMALTSRVDYSNPRVRAEFVARPPLSARQIATESVPEVSFEERRPLDGAQRGFGAVLNRHEENHDQRFWNTTNGDVYGEGQRGRMPRLDPAVTEHAAGVGTEQEECRNRGVKVGLLCGEKFVEATDPSGDTRTQRAWIYTGDAALNHLSYGGPKSN
eukprot:TRINITY_DN15037_c0_g1_i5.p2 TRINITY_DN15037_c0_g1~~TRINITY_DN15037_c0_g1_i5.p2  ORF type:complete len:232 (-),score=24.75 TRINITY_DN15037_c0_g1_i5:446-1141(-)